MDNNKMFVAYAETSTGKEFRFGPCDYLTCTDGLLSSIERAVNDGIIETGTITKLVITPVEQK